MAKVEEAKAGRGGAREGAGRPAGTKAPDEVRCTYIDNVGNRCGNAAAKVDPERQRCRFHGGSRSTIEKEQARQHLRELAAEIRLAEPKKDADYLTVCAEYIARLNRHFALLEVALDAKRLEQDDVAGEISLTEEYAHILAEQRATAREVRDTMKTAATIGLMAKAGDMLDAVASQLWVKTRTVFLDVLENHPDVRAELDARLAEVAGLSLSLPVLDAELVEDDDEPDENDLL